jgi:uncharacterized protein YgfB (UPF0149 family)
MINYDELKLTTINTNSKSDEERARNLVSGDLLGSINLGGCIGSGCCSDGTTWNINKSTCMVCNNASAFGAEDDWAGYEYNGTDSKCQQIEAEPFTTYEGLISKSHSTKTTGNALSDMVSASNKFINKQTDIATAQATLSGAKATQSAVQANRSMRHQRFARDNAQRSSNQANRSSNQANRSGRMAGISGRLSRIANNNAYKAKKFARNARNDASSSEISAEKSGYFSGVSTDSANDANIQARNSISAGKDAIIASTAQTTNATQAANNVLAKAGIATTKLEQVKNDVGKLVGEAREIATTNANLTEPESFTTLNYSIYKII